MENLSKETVLLLYMWYMLFTFSSCENTPETCPNCQGANSRFQQDEVLADVASLRVSIKWCALEGAPIVSDPSICYPINNVMPNTRSLLASFCVWYPQCKIIFEGFGIKTLDSPLVVPKLEAGDILRSDYHTIEMILTACHEAWDWSENPADIMGISVGEIVDFDGDGNLTSEDVADGFQYYAEGIGGSAFPFFFINDPEYILGENNEAVLAHELGHALNLCHTDEVCNVALSDDFNLMRASINTSQTELDENQCNQARLTALEISEMRDRRLPIAIVFDNSNQTDDQETTSSLDLSKITVIDSVQFEGDLKVNIGINGFLPRTPVTYWITIDADADTTTGFYGIDYIPFSSQKGVEFALEVGTSIHGDIDKLKLFDGRTTEFMSQNRISDLLTGEVQIIEMNVLRERECTRFPVATEIELTIDRKALSLLGLAIDENPLFPEGLNIQAIAFNTKQDDKFFDLCPDVSTFCTILK